MKQLPPPAPSVGPGCDDQGRITLRGCRARDEDAANHVNDAESQKNEDHQLCFAQSSRVLAPSLVQHLTSERFRIRRRRRVTKVDFDPIETEMPVAMNDIDCLSAARFVKCSNDR
ncbi:hypothetical protein BJA5080_03567 [Bradyrhizobium diazoefficiens SEMIA 5080]|uniref:Uncharacterized protein n=1 Tax=Bradyrhizobium diazoefficiens SEMIA 5080 TaxID=754504 RepID=A0A837CD67_9BRAD|nr:hypothetical protein BJA5080_03567 [Bradyrhizobium diazoefficiens SEMIA 5080]